jgi:hypothetical protein
MRNLLITIVLLSVIVACSDKDVTISKPEIYLETGDFTHNGDVIPLGGKITFGIIANGGEHTLTNIRVQRVANGKAITEVDRGIFVPKGNYEFVLNAVKGESESETWRFMAMNSNRDSTVISLNVLLGEGTAYGQIKHFPSIKIGMQSNTEHPHFLDLSSGTAYTNQSVIGNEATIDLLAFVYQTSGVWSPTLNCPQYSTAPSYYPVVSGWQVRNSTLYDYNAVDNNVVNLNDFISASNDSLLVVSFKPGTSSGNCKFSFTGKIAPFKTQNGKYGLIRVIHADETVDGYMELEVKIQE